MRLQHPSSCLCCSDLWRGAFHRRRFMAGAASGFAALALGVGASAADTVPTISYGWYPIR